MKNIEFLTEHKLGLLLEQIFPDSKWEYDKCVPNSKLRCRADFRSDDLKLIVEFNGDRCNSYCGHYSSTDVILRDSEKLKTYSDLGYTVIEWPYFVQPSTEVIKKLFNVNFKIDQQYPHGFIDNFAKLPSDFCMLGIERFIKDLDTFDFIESEIMDSLFQRIKVSDTPSRIIPNILFDFLMSTNE